MQDIISLPNRILISSFPVSSISLVYLVQKAIPMLPHILCENLCSLNPGVERLAFSVIWTLDSEGNISDEWFGKTIIKSCSKMPYDAAQMVIEGKIKTKWNDVEKISENKWYENLGPMGDHRVEDIVQDILSMWGIAKNLRKKRFDVSSRSISSPPELDLNRFHHVDIHSSSSASSSPICFDNIL